MISKETNLGAEDTKTIKWIKGNILLLVHDLQQWIVFKGRWKSEESIMLAGVRVFYNFFSVIAHSAWFIFRVCYITRNWCQTNNVHSHRVSKYYTLSIFPNNSCNHKNYHFLDCYWYISDSSIDQSHSKLSLKSINHIQSCS